MAVRFGLTLAILAPIVFILKHPLPQSITEYRHIFVSGALIHIAYLGGVFSAIKMGLPAGITAIIVGFQPILTLLSLKGSRSHKNIIIAIAGLVGLFLVVTAGNIHHLQWQAQQLVPVFIALIGITYGTLYQKRYCSDINMVSLAFLQYIPTFLIFMFIALLYEGDSEIIWHIDLVASLFWLSIVLSIGAILLMNVLYQKNSSHSAANYFYLAPPLAIIQGSIFFNESITFVSWIGILLILGCIYFSNRFKSKKST